MLLAQIIPDPDKLMDASNSLIVDQGIAIFAVVVFAIVIFGMMGLMFMMQRQTGAMLRQMGKESSQQDKLITQNDLNRVAAQRNTDEIIDVKKLLAKLIEVQMQGDDKKNATIESGIESIDKTTESVNTMNGKLEDLAKAVNDMIQTTNDRYLEIVAKVETLSDNMDTVLERLDELAKDAETPTEETTVIIDPGEPSIGKLKTVGKPTVGITPAKPAGTYPEKPDKDETESV